MLTEIFANRYADREIWFRYTNREKRLLLQSFRIISEQIAPYYMTLSRTVSEPNKAFWEDIQNRLSTELGVQSLSALGYQHAPRFNGNQITSFSFYPMVNVCENWMLEAPGPHPIDTHMKERLSLVEIALRKKQENVDHDNAQLRFQIEDAKSNWDYSTGHEPGDVLRTLNRSKNNQLQTAISELNTRFKQAGCKLHYHRGYIQISEDDLVLKEVEEPYWALLSDPLWKNVDIDMKEAIDQRDGGGRDPAWYAARALESTIKIISDQKGWTHGRENGAHNYIDNLAKKSSGFIEKWEAAALKAIFSDVRNPFGHGAGSKEMPKLAEPQTNMAIGVCIVWIRSLISRL